MDASPAREAADIVRLEGTPALGADHVGVPSPLGGPGGARARSGETQAEPEAARLGNPSYVWRGGQDRRLAIIERHVRLDGQRVLDLGCGVGEYVRAFARRGAAALGCDVEMARLAEARTRGTTSVVAAAGEALPFRTGSLDVVVLNEVLEHVQDDAATMREVGRVLGPGGTCVIFAPNRLFPFETHGVYVTFRGKRRYIFGNIPLVNWLPSAWRDRLVPHARVYTRQSLDRAVASSGLDVVARDHVFPGFDNLAARLGAPGRVLRRVMHVIEDSPLRSFGISHVYVLRKSAVR